MVATLVPRVLQIAEAAAAVLAQCGSVRPAPVAMFRGVLLHPHWAERHIAMESLAAYMRAVVDDSDLRSVVPAELQAQGTRQRANVCARNLVALCADYARPCS